MSLNSFENELLSDWINGLKNKKEEYVEPILAPETVNMIKLACTTFNQDIYVFIMSIEILESYIRKKKEEKKELSDNTLTVSAIVFLSSKYVGEQDLKVVYIEKFLQKITGKTYNSATIKLAEMEILSTLSNKLPVTTRVDDLNTFVTKYETEFRLKFSIRVLCLDILEALYFKREKWFYGLKSIYIQNQEALSVFKSLVSSRYYLPIGILLYAMWSTRYQLSVDIDTVVEELSSNMQIHVDHLNILVLIIQKVIHLD